MNLYIGLMSGTSMDGIDVALIDGSTQTFVTGITKPYTDNLKTLLCRLVDGYCDNIGQICQLNTLLGREFAEAALLLINQAKINVAHVKAIGSHGQTICHNTSGEIPYTLQLGCGHTIAEKTGITVVADFRSRDLVVGGQGAPFAPIYHQVLFNHIKKPLAIVNIGGISNISCIHNDDNVSGYDVGPGNCLMDAWIKRHLGKDYDSGGNWALSGHVITPLLELFQQDPYFSLLPPKSVGKEYFSLNWLESYLNNAYPPVDVQATLLELTAWGIARAIEDEAVDFSNLLVCGGGAHNKGLLKSLTRLLPRINVQSTEAYQINPDFIEASMFAWLAEKALNNTPTNMKAITGARTTTILGVIYPKGIDKSMTPGCNVPF